MSKQLDNEKELEEKVNSLDERMKKIKQERKDTLKELEYVKRRKQDEFYIRLGKLYEESMLREGNADGLPEDLKEEFEKRIGEKPEYE